MNTGDRKAVKQYLTDKGLNEQQIKKFGSYWASCKKAEIIRARHKQIGT